MSSVQKLDKQPRNIKERHDDEERAIWNKERQTLKENTRSLQQEPDKEHRKHIDISRCKGKQDTAPDDVLHKRAKGRLGHELDNSDLLSTNKTNNAIETKSELRTRII